MTAPTVSVASWVAQAACGPVGEGFASLPVLHAVAVCRGCPVMAECREWARLERYDGVAGGALLAEGYAAGERRTCVNCGAGLSDRNPKARYCSARPCRSAREKARERQRGGTPWGETSHGTPAGARWHYRRGEKPCHACLLANRRAWHDHSQKRSGA